jgi:predicted AlkP superfamily pyrophosphatase or phosphodiesterase
MKRKIVLLLVLTWSSLFLFGQHVVLISVDGMRPGFYLDKAWPAPNLQNLSKEGVYADHMLSVFPSYTYPSHTAMLTGALPARSGIYYNVKNEAGEWNWFTKDIKVPTLWQAIKQAGLTSSAIEWPVSVDSNITWNIPEIWNTDNPEDRITATRKYATPGLIEAVEKYATGMLDSNSMNEEYLSLDENAGRMAAYIFKTYRPNLLCVHFACVDGAEHEVGREGDKVRMAVASADRAIGEVLEVIERSGMKDSTTIIVVGDHGFADIHQALQPNSWIQDLPARFVAAGGSAFLYLKNKKDAATLNEVLKRLKQVDKNYRIRFDILDRKALDKMGADSSAALALSAVPGTVFGGGIKGEVMFPVHGGHHGYDPNLPEMYTGFIAAGAGINKGTVINELCVTDIAPLIAKLLGLDFKTPDGRLVEGILKGKMP